MVDPKGYTAFGLFATFSLEIADSCILLERLFSVRIGCIRYSFYIQELYYVYIGLCVTGYRLGLCRLRSSAL